MNSGGPSNPSKWAAGVQGTFNYRNGGLYQDLQALAVALGHGKMPQYNSARLAGMLAEHMYWYTAKVDPTQC